MNLRHMTLSEKKKSSHKRLRGMSQSLQNTKTIKSIFKDIGTISKAFFFLKQGFKILEMINKTFRMATLEERIEAASAGRSAGIGNTRVSN